MRFFITITIFLMAEAIFAQDALNKIKSEYMNFQYNEVIKDADELLKNKTVLDSSSLIELYRLKGISHYSLSQDKEAEQCFRNILAIDNSFSLKPTEDSPKIIAFFNQIKQQYIEGLPRPVEEKIILKPDTVYITKTIEVPLQTEDVKPIIVRSLILPGWGHLYSGETNKGLILSILSSASILSSVYFIFDASNKADAYSNEVDISRIQRRYDEYNRSYKLRNFSLLSFAAVWIYSQLDILYLRRTDLSSTGTSLSLKLYF